MNNFLYSRVSTIDQNTDMQKIALEKAYPEGLYFEEKKSGTSMDDREVLQSILTLVRPGDRIVCYKLDRISRSLFDLAGLIKKLKDLQVSLKILDLNIDTGTATGMLFLQMLGVFSEFETSLRAERQASGIAAAKARGQHMGRPRAFTEMAKREVKAKFELGRTPAELALEYNVSRASIYKAIKSAVHGVDPVEVQMALL